jgi:hypothetical protein
VASNLEDPVRGHGKVPLQGINFPHILGNSEWTVAKSFMTNGLLKYGEIFAHFLIY